MPYSDAVKKSVTAAPKTIGNQLGRWAVHLDFPVMAIAQYTGATRQTVYNWFNGTEVTNAYKERVRSLLNILQTSKTIEEALRKCNQLM
jgi:predicted metalloendopeptidase